ncbi:MAG: radical SAM protein [Spirochaetia bacterium]|nr:radical SAM protein [Spirochaetia bacterium]
MQRSLDSIEKVRINWHSQCLKARYGEKVWRLGLDAGFTCPNRSADRLQGGCRFCAADGNISAYQKSQTSVPNGNASATKAINDRSTIEDQIRHALAFTRQRYKAKAFFLYFQAYTCTNAPVSMLAKIYNDAIKTFMRIYYDTQKQASVDLKLSDISMTPLKGIIVSTRPDCFDIEKAELLASYRKQDLEVWIEFGLQSAHEKTLAFINRGHGIDEFLIAMDIAKKAQLNRTVHIILGLPGESHRDMIETIKFVAQIKPEGLKFHDLHLVKGSAFARSFHSGEITLMHPSRLPVLIADCLELLPPSTEIMRLSADFRPEETINLFPQTDKHKLARAVEEELLVRDSFQGRRFEMD